MFDEHFILFAFIRYLFYFRFFLCFDLLKDQCYISLGRALPNAYNSNFDEDKMHKKIIKNKDFYQIYTKKKLVLHSYVFYYA